MDHPAPPPSEESAIRAAFEARPDLEASRRDVERARAAVSSERREGLPVLAASLKCRLEAEAAYAAMIAAPRYKKPLTWAKARAADFAALHFPGGHAPGMKPYCESAEVQRLTKEAFAAKQPVSAICHGVLPLARAGVLKGRRTTALTHIMEEISVRLTARSMPGHYRTYPISVEDEVP